MSAIDPSYIRNIRDGLINEHIEANNIEALPEGLVGLYDKELFPPTLNWKQRKETLQFFLVFALAQKEISADFAATILGDEWCKVLANENETTEEKRLKKVNEFIQLHSKRFKSAGEGKYRLYHERFRVYILQKVSEGDLAQFNHKFISLCESELKKNSEKDISEKEIYALEFLSHHLMVDAFHTSDGKYLLDFVINKSKIERQIQISHAFEWSKNDFRNAIQFTSKDNDKVTSPLHDELIDLGLGLVKLNHTEQSDIYTIVKFVKNNQIDIALERIATLGGSEIEQLEKQFVVYIICLIELLLLESNDQDYKKEATEKMVKHLSKNESIKDLYWNDLISPQLLFLLIKEIYFLEILSYLDIDLKLFLIDIIEYEYRLDELNKNDIDVIVEIINNQYAKEDSPPIYSSLLKELILKKNFELDNSIVEKLAIKKNNVFIYYIYKCKYLLEIYEVKMAESLFNFINEFESLNTILEKSEDKDFLLEKLSFTGIYWGIFKYFTRKINLVTEPYYLKLFENHNNNSVRDEIAIEILKFYLQLNLLDDFIYLKNKITTFEYIIEAMSLELSYYFDKDSESQFSITLTEIENKLDSNSDSSEIDFAIKKIVLQLVKNKKFDLSLQWIKRIEKISDRNWLYCEYLSEYAYDKDKIDFRYLHIKEILKLINDDFIRNEALIKVSDVCIEIGLTDDAIKFANLIKGLDSISKQLFKVEFNSIKDDDRSLSLIIEKYKEHCFIEIQTALTIRNHFSLIRNLLIEKISIKKTENLEFLINIAIEFIKSNQAIKSIFLIEKYLSNLINENLNNDHYFHFIFYNFCTGKNYKYALDYILKYNFSETRVNRLRFIAATLLLNRFKKESEEVLYIAISENEQLDDTLKVEPLMKLSYIANDLGLTILKENLILQAINYAENLNYIRSIGILCEQLIYQGLIDEVSNLKKKIPDWDKASLWRIGKANQIVDLIYEKLQSKYFIDELEIEVKSRIETIITVKNQFYITNIFNIIDLINDYIDSKSLIEMEQLMNFISFDDKSKDNYKKILNTIYFLRGMSDSKNKFNGILDQYKDLILLEKKWFNYLVYNSLSSSNSYFKLIRPLNLNLFKLEEILCLYVINKAYNSEVKDNQFSLFINIFNLQWAIDIKNQLPN